jgi:hypothetical protein
MPIIENIWEEEIPEANQDKYSRTFIFGVKTS